MRVAAIAAGLVLFGSGFAGYQLFVSNGDVLDTCKDAPRKDVCYNDLVDETFHAHGLSAALDVLASAYDADPSYFSMCHAQTHTLGEIAYKEFHETGAVELSSKTTYCGYGFYHGFMEALIADTGDYSEAKKFCAYAGTVLPIPHGYTEGACYHGIGHGVTDGTDPRLWGSATRIAAPGLSLCAKVAGSDESWHRRCASGVFNGVAILHREGRYTLDDGNPYRICEAGSYARVEKEACYDQMNTLVMQTAGYDFTRAVQKAHAVDDAAYRKIALHGISGMYFSNVRSRHKPFSAREVSDACASTGDNAASCITWVIAGIQEFGTPGVEYQDMFPLCDSAELDRAYVQGCYRDIVTSTRYFYDESVVQRVCERVPSQYRSEACSV